MNLNTAKTVREVALEVPAATRVFEQLGIDYCCGGNKSLEEACGAANLEIQRLLNSVESAATAAGRRREGSNWQAGPLADLIAHISNTHHKYTREEIARLSPLLEEVVSVHREQHRELLGVCENFHALAREITTHMMKEETVLFPYIERLEEAMLEREPVLPPPFGTVQNSVATNDARALRRWKPGVQHMQSAACERLRELPYSVLVACGVPLSPAIYT